MIHFIYKHIYSFFTLSHTAGWIFKYFVLQLSLHERQRNCNLRGLFLETVMRKKPVFMFSVCVCVCERERERDFYSHGHIYRK